MSARVRRRRGLAVLILAAVVAAGAWAWGPGVWSRLTPFGDDGGPDAGQAQRVLDASPTTGPSDSNGIDPADGSADGSDPPSQTPSVTTDPADDTADDGSADEPTRAALPAGLTAADVAAGLLSADVPQSGDGRLHTVEGDVDAPGKGRVYKIRVQVEGGLDIDRAKFAAFVMKVLNDDRSWGHGGTKTFARTAGTADVTVVLASPTLSAQMCRPLVTGGKLSCRQGNHSILTDYRWVKAIPGYGDDRTGYREYVVNHEVGHALGHGHEYCAGSGRLAPVMMQQTKGLGACKPNPWPFP